MPFLQRVIEPVYVCRNTLPLDDQGILAVEVPNELECVTNGTLSNIIRQLSSLSKHAEDMFSCLFRESSKIVSRVSALQVRMDRLGVKVTQLDSTIEEVSLQDIHMRKAFKSNISFEQQIVSRESMPAAMKEIFLLCDKPPPLDKLNPYREDGKDGLKFYTDPNYFFDLWKQEMLKDTEKLQHDRGKKVVHSKEILEHPSQRARHDYKKHKKSRQLHASKEKSHQSKPMNIMNSANHYQLQYGRPVNRMGNNIQPDAQPVRPNSLELHSSFFNQQQPPYPVNSKNQYPPPPPAYTEHPISPQQHYPPPPYVAASPDIPMSPSRRSLGTPKTHYSMRPCQPPPIPPVSNSTSSSGSSTPTASAETPSSGASRYHRNVQSRNNLPPPPPPPTTFDVQSSSVPSPPLVAAQSPPNALSETPTHKPEEKYVNNIDNKKVEVGSIHSTSSSSNSSKKNSLETVVKEPNIDEPDLPTPPPIPKPNGVAEKIDNTSEIVATAPVPIQETVLQPPPPPPPPLPPIEDLVLDTAENGSISDNQNVDVISITSESASETSSLSKLSEQHFDGKLKLSGNGDGRSDLLQAIREGIKLRRVEDHKKKEVEKAAPLHDVASILARRVAMEFSDSSSSESECDSDGWEEESEHTKAKQEKNITN